MPLPDSDTLSTYGGLAKQNYAAVPPANPLVDWDNTELTPAVSNVAGMTLMIPRLQVQMTLASTTGALVINNWWAVWKNATNTAPIAGRTSTGVFTITTPTLVSDEYNQSLGIVNNHTVNLLSCVGSNLEGASGVYSVSISCVANVVTIKTFNGSGANDFAGLVLDFLVR